jgi:TonB family protein
MKNHYLSFLLFSLISLTTTAQKHGAIQLQHLGFATINFGEAQFFAGDQFLGKADESGFFQPTVAAKKKIMVIHPLCDTLLMDKRLDKDDYLFVELKSKNGLDSIAKATFLENYVSQCGDKVIEKQCDSLANFKGGKKALLKFLGENIRYPQNAIEQGISGKVYTTFIVDEQGKVSCFEIAKSSGNEGLDKEALRVVKTFPKFEPAMKNGIFVTSVYFMPIIFKLQ